MRIIDILIENGLNQIMLVGDPDQAIFEWNDAKPYLLNRKYEEWENSMVLNENRRSSQRICNFTFNISSLQEPSFSVTDNVKDFHFQPKVILYNDNLPQIVDAFLDECNQNRIEVSKENVAVIYRSKNIFNDITGVPQIPYNSSPWHSQDNYSKDFAKGKYLYDNGDFKGGFKAIEKAILKQVQNLQFCSEDSIAKMIDKMGYINFKSQIFNFIKLLPTTDSSLGVWIDETNSKLTENKINFQLSITNAGRDYSFAQIFQHEEVIFNDRNYRLGTVHSVKGETFDAVLLILKTKGIGKAYKTILRHNISIMDSEELRIAYVGMTRPRKILVIAVPDNTNKTAWETKLFNS